MQSKSKVALWTYHISTVLLGLFLLAGFTDYFPPPMIAETIKKLGYPSYLGYIIGTAKLLAFLALVYPKAVRLREWAYAGLTFLLLGAFSSHMISADYSNAPGPLVVLVLVATSYFSGGKAEVKKA